VERHGVAADGEAEVGRVRAAIDGEVAERAGELAVRGEDAADALDGGEVSVREEVAAVDRRRQLPLLAR